MADQITRPPTMPTPILPISSDSYISADEYMEHYAHDFYEWVDGEVYPMAPVADNHDELAAYCQDMFRAYFALRPIGRVKEAPFVLRLDSMKAYREPDLMVILNNNPGQFTDTAMVGPADICVEIISLESVDRDYGKKFVEYEAGGVKEYWLFDPIRAEARFHRLNAEGRYQSQPLDADGNYESPLLPGLKIHVETLWESPLPDFFAIGEAVKAMLGKP